VNKLVEAINIIRWLIWSP